MQKMKTAYGISVGNAERRNQLENFCVDCRIILNWMLEE
jgi:hypothetical protein